MMPNLASLVSAASGPAMPSAGVTVRSPTSSAHQGLPRDDGSVSASAGAQEGRAAPDAGHKPRSQSKTKAESSISRRKAEFASPSPNSRSPSRVEMPSGVPNFHYREGPAFDRTHIDPDQDEEIELGLHVEDEAVSAELQELYTSFQVSVPLRYCAGRPY